MRLRLVKEPFDHPNYIFEPKHDGFRALAYIQRDKLMKFETNQTDYKQKLDQL